jgi:hypothetical protein
MVKMLLAFYLKEQYCVLALVIGSFQFISCNCCFLLSKEHHQSIGKEVLLTLLAIFHKKQT